MSEFCEEIIAELALGEEEPKPMYMERDAARPVPEVAEQFEYV